MSSDVTTVTLSETDWSSTVTCGVTDSSSGVDPTDPSNVLEEGRKERVGGYHPVLDLDRDNRLRRRFEDPSLESPLR
jgi:hypothetical protein